MNEVIVSPGAAGHTTARAHALFQAGILMMYCDDIDKAQGYEEESLFISQELNYLKGEADALFGLGWVAHWTWRNHDAAIQHLERSLACYKKLDDREGISMSLWFLSRIALSRADFSRAQTLNEESLANAQQAGFQFNWPLNTLGDIAFAKGELVRARSLLEQSLAIERQDQHYTTTFGTLFGLAVMAVWQKDHTVAQAVLGEILSRMTNRSKEDTNLCFCLMILAMLEQDVGNYGNAVRWYRASLPGLKYNRDEWGNWGTCLVRLAIALNRYEVAVTLISATEASAEEHHPLWPIYQNECNRLANEARAHLSAEQCDTAWNRGQDAAFKQVVEEAVSILEEVVRTREETAPG